MFNKSRSDGMFDGTRIGAFSFTSLELHLQSLDVRNLVIIGLPTDVCALAAAAGGCRRLQAAAGCPETFDLSHWNWNRLEPGAWNFSVLSIRRNYAGVHTTMRQANDRGYECILLSDCTAAAFSETYYSAAWQKRRCWFCLGAALIGKSQNVFGGSRCLVLFHVS